MTQTTTALPETLRKRAENLRARARLYSGGAYATLGITAILLFLSGNMFLQEGSLPGNVVRKRMADVESKFAVVEGALTEWKTRSDNFIAATDGLLKTGAQQCNQVDYINARNGIIDTQNFARETRVKLDELSAYVRTSLPDAVPIPAEESHNLLITTVVIRAGMVVVAILLFVFFSSGYRYNTRLSYFYDARADALEAFPSAKPAQLISLMAALTPDVDFKPTNEAGPLEAISKLLPQNKDDA